MGFARPSSPYGPPAPATVAKQICLASYLAVSQLSQKLSPISSDNQPFPLGKSIHWIPWDSCNSLRQCPTDQANPYPYVRERIEKSDWKFNRLEKLLPRGQLVSWPVSHLSQLSRSVPLGKNIGPNLSVYGVSTGKNIGLKLLFASDLRKFAK